MSAALDYTRQEMMAIATGREIRDGELAIFGVGLSMLAGFFAQANHAPNLRSMTEGGVYGATPVGGLPWGIECNRLAVNATSFTSALDALGFLVASGRCDVGVIGAAQVDKFGNVNTTGVWDGDIGPHYRAPKTRLPGAGGANDIACGAKRFIVMVTHEPKRFAEKVTYISSPGYLDGGLSRDETRLRRGRALCDHHHARHLAAGAGHERIRARRLVPVFERRGDQGQHRLGASHRPGRARDRSRRARPNSPICAKSMKPAPCARNNPAR